MKNTFLSLAFLFVSLLSFQSSFAQMGKEGDELLTQIQTQIAKLKNAYINEHFKLNETESKAFWAIYQKYNTNSSELAMKMQGRSNEMVDKNSATDEQKLANMEYEMKIKMIKLEQVSAFHKELKEALSAAKVLEFYKVEKEFEKKLSQLLH